MPVADRLPEGYRGYQSVSLCGNELRNTGVWIQVGEHVPLLIGRGEKSYPQIWLAGPIGENGEWIEILSASEMVSEMLGPTRQVSIIFDYRKPETTVTIGGVVVVVARHFSADDSLVVPNLDLRPIGLKIFGDEFSGLLFGSNTFRRNTFQGVGVAFQVAD